MVQIENASENEKEEKKMIKSGKTIAITNRKGGSGKTTTAKNIAYDLTLCNKKVLLIDLDPQCNATEGLSGRKYSRSVIGMLQLENVHKCIYKTRFNDLDILPGNDYLASTEILDDVLYRQISPLRNEYDFILIFCIDRREGSDVALLFSLESCSLVYMYQSTCFQCLLLIQATAFQYI